MSGRLIEIPGIENPISDLLGFEEEGCMVRLDQSLGRQDRTETADHCFGVGDVLIAAVGTLKIQVDGVVEGILKFFLCAS